jgi:hypothetical protein
MQNGMTFEPGRIKSVAELFENERFFYRSP